MKKQYDYLIVGAGLYGAVFAHQASQNGKKCLVIDRRPHIGGNLYCENIAGINVHQYGPHIFHTSDVEVWNFVNSFVSFNRFTNEPLANYKGKLYNMPFNMNTFRQLWDITNPSDAKIKIEEQPNVILRDLFYYVVSQTTGSHASLYNYMNYGDIYSEFLGEIIIGAGGWILLCKRNLLQTIGSADNYIFIRNFG